jgi:hypothetical protein
VATLSSLVDRVRLELGDLGKSFVVQFMADGSTNRFTIQYAPIDAEALKVFADGADISELASVEEQTGTLVMDAVPVDGTFIIASGTYFRYFTSEELEYFVKAAVEQHAGTKTDTTGRKITMANLPSIEDYPVALYASTLALYTLATDAAFDINIFAPDGITIPRSERYRQLMEMIDSRREQYRELCVQLGIGLYSIEVFSFRRISKMTNRYVPVYKPQEVDDKSRAQRVDIPLPTYGTRPVPWPTDGGELLAYETIAFTKTFSITGDYSGKKWVARLLSQRNAVYIVRNLDLKVSNSQIDTITDVARVEGETTATLVTSSDHALVGGETIHIQAVNEELNASWTVASVPTTTSFTITTTETTAIALTEQYGSAEAEGEKTYTVTMSLTAENTRLLPNRTYWQIANLDSGGDATEILGGQFFTERASEVIL